MPCSTLPPILPRILLFQQKGQVLEPIKTAWDLDFRGTSQVLTSERFASCPLAYFACCQPVGQTSFICLLNGELRQISM
jgi:hypothetical protein